MTDNDPGARKDKRPRDPELWIHRPMEKYRKNRDRLAHRPTTAFFQLADPVVQAKRTLLGYDRLYVFWQAIQNIGHLDGAVAEIGSYRGGSAYFIADAFRTVMQAEAEIHIFDTFEGHPASAITGDDPFHTPGRFGDTSYEDVSEYLSGFSRLELHKGDILESLPQLAERQYRLVHIDTDLYQPTLACLSYFGRRLLRGGIVILDDYASSKCPGVPKAVGEYLDGTDDFHVWDMRTEQLVLVRR